MRGEGSTQAGRAQLWTAWWGPDKGHRRPSLQPSPGTAQLSLSRMSLVPPGLPWAAGAPGERLRASLGAGSVRRRRGGQVPSVPPQVRITAMFCGNSSLLHGNPGPGRGPLTRSGAPLLPSAGRGGRSASLSHLLDLMWFLFLFPVTYDTLLQSPGNSPR